MDTKVKICGLTRPEDVAAAEHAGADFLGFIVEAESSRKLSIEDADALIQDVKTNTVAVTVDPDDRLIYKILLAGFTHIQLHGNEGLSRTAQIAAQTDLKVIKAVPVATDDDVKLATEFSGAADLLLFDAKPPEQSDQRGGPRGGIGGWVFGRGPQTKTFIF
ncbi:MAG: hypothetical protein AAF926_06135, partial [Pseudomonadota bacterium]